MGQSKGNLWYFTFFPNGVALGIIGVLIPLYFIQVLNASLIDLGTMTFVASVLLIPTSMYFGSLPDRYRISKPFILISLLGVSVVLYLMANVTSVIIFEGLFVAMELLDYLRGPSMSILIAESFEKASRSSVLAKQAFVESIGSVVGLVICVLAVNMLGYKVLFSFAAPLVFASFIMGLITLWDSPLYIERSMDRVDSVIEEMEGFSYHLTNRGALAPDFDGEWRFGHQPNMMLFGIGRALFSFAASNAFITITIFLIQGAKFSSSTVFEVFLIRSIFGALSYLFTNRLATGNGDRAVKVGTLLRIIIVGLFPLIIWLPMPYSIIIAAIFLSIVALSYSVYTVGVGIVSLLYAAPGSLGFYDAIANIGGAFGSYSGGLIPTLYGFETLFVVSSILFAIALVLFYMSMK